MKTYQYNDIIKMSNDLVDYSYRNIKGTTKTTKLLAFPIFLMNEDLCRSYRNDKSNGSNNWTYKIIAKKICPFLLEFKNGDIIKIEGYKQLFEIFKKQIDYKTISFTVYKGETNCDDCPFYNHLKDACCLPPKFELDCDKHDLSTLIINR